MTLGLCFWILMLVSLVFGAWVNWPNPRGGGWSFLVWCLFFLVGWRIFGAPIHG